MAQKHWKRYYAPIMVHKETGACRLWKGKLFKSREQAYVRVLDINEYSKNWRAIGMAAIRGKKSNAKLQKYLLENSY